MTCRPTFKPWRWPFEAIFLVQGDNSNAEADYAVGLKLFEDYKDGASTDLKGYIEAIEKCHFRAKCLVEGKDDPGPGEEKMIPSREARPSAPPQHGTSGESDENLVTDEAEDEDEDEAMEEDEDVTGARSIVFH